MKTSSKGMIALAGNGWGFWAALKSLITSFNKIEIYNPLESESVKKFINENSSVRFVIHSQMQDISSNHIVCAGLKDIITLEMLEQKKFINIHYSLLPGYRGLHSTVWAIINNEPYLGYTVHLMNEFIDDGDVIYQYRTNNDFILTATDYMKHFNAHVEQNLSSVILNYLNEKITPVVQDKSKASWVGRRNLNDCEINFNSTIFELKAFFRALSIPYPQPFFTVDGIKYIPKTIKFHPANVKTHLGRILNVDNEGVWIKIKDGYIVCDEIINEAGNKIANRYFNIGKRLLYNNKNKH